MRLNCGHFVRDESNPFRCEICGKFLYNIFLGEPFPRGYDSPLRELLRKIYYSLDQVGGKINELGTNQLKTGMENAINQSEICFFDLTDDIFNVAYEIGLSLATCFSPIEKKYIMFGCSDDFENHALFNIKIFLFRLLPHRKDLAEQVKRYIPGQFNTLNVLDDIQACDKEIRKKATIYLEGNDLTIQQQNNEFYPKILDYPAKSPEKKVLVITSDEFQQYYNDVNFPDDSVPHFLSSESPFLGVEEMKYLIENISQQIIKKYDYLIVHLFGDNQDNVDFSRRYNFQAGVISGMMKGLKKKEKNTGIKKEYQPNFYIAHKNNTYPNLRCTDINIFKRYTNNNQISSIVNQIIQTRIL